MVGGDVSAAGATAGHVQTPIGIGGIEPQIEDVEPIEERSGCKAWTVRIDGEIFGFPPVSTAIVEKKSRGRGKDGDDKWVLQGLLVNLIVRGGEGAPLPLPRASVRAWATCVREQEGKKGHGQGGPCPHGWKGKWHRVVGPLARLHEREARQARPGCGLASLSYFLSISCPFLYLFLFLHLPLYTCILSFGGST